MGPIAVIGGIKLELLLVPLLFLVMLAVTVWDYNRRLSPVSQALREQFGTMNAGLTEAIAGIEVVKANVQESYEWDKFTQNASKFRPARPLLLRRAPDRQDRQPCHLGHAGLL